MIAVAAMDLNRVIGKDGKLPWPSIKEDFKFFKNLTMGKNIIVGRKTFDTLPKLEGRKVYCLTNHMTSPVDISSNFMATDYKDIPNYNELIVCGGAQIYELLLPKCSELYLTIVKKEYDGDTYMPRFEHLFKMEELLYSDDLIDIQKYVRVEESIK